MANQTEIGELSINLKLRLEGLEKGLETAKNKLQEIEKQNKQVENSNKGLDASFIAMAVSIVASMKKVIAVINDSIEEYKSYTQAMSSLSDVADYTGNSLSDMSQLMNKYSKYMTKGDLAATIKNFSLMNMTMEQTDQIIGDLINSAIKNRNANYTVSEAVKVASDGYKQGLSTLSDSAGVTENLSVMQDNYAKSIGKTASQLTEEEKNQAYVNRTMEAAAPFAGAMEEYLDTLAGKQGEYSQALRETKIAYAEALEPTLVWFEEFKTQIMSGLGELISEHKDFAAGITAFVKKAWDVLNTTIKASPLGITITAITAVVSALAGLAAAFNSEFEEIEKVNKALEEHNKVMQDKIKLDEANVASLENVAKKSNEYIDLLNEQKKVIEEINIPEEGVSAWEQTQLAAKYGEDFIEKADEISDSTDKMKVKYLQLQEQIASSNKELKDVTGIEERMISEKKAIDISDKYADQAQKAKAIQEIQNATNLKSVRIEQQEADAQKLKANQMQEYLNIVNTADKTTTEYQEALKALIKEYPEAANGEQLIGEKAQDCINADQLRADQAWNTSQQTIAANTEIINTFIALAKAAENDAEMQSMLAEAIGVDYANIIPTLTSVLNTLQAIGGQEQTKVPGVSTQVSAPKKSSASGSYQNKVLDNYKKQIEYKKALDQLSLQDEINMYQYALNKYAKTADEKMDLNKKIYELQKELQEKELNDYTSQIDYEKQMGYISAQQEIERYEYAYNNIAKTFDQRRDLELKLHDLREQLNEETTQNLKEQADKEREILNQKTADYERYIQDQKNKRGAEYDVKDQEKDYNKIIELHRKYLNQIMKDERYSLEERESIYRGIRHH